ncbi:hypothetical protein TYRP_020832 [Tyrophagus putrescentiae]|nr:hypothetical protein TYRP_020832 [Tyrophagus putrescentiae]
MPSSTVIIDWCHLVDRHRPTAWTQLASSLCPKPSVPINQMTPAFNIWVTDAVRLSTAIFWKHLT